MATSETTEIGKIDVTGPYKALSVRTDTITLEDGAEVARSFHRESIVPGADVSSYPQEVQDAVSEYHTQEVIEAYEAYKSSQG